MMRPVFLSHTAMSLKGVDDGGYAACMCVCVCSAWCIVQRMGIRMRQPCECETKNDRVV